MKLYRLLASLILAAILLTACAPAAAPAASDAAPAPAADAPKLRIAEQFGLGYAMLTVAREQKMFEKYLPGLQVEWQTYGSGGAINEAFVAGQVDAAIMGIPPFLIGWDKGIPWKVASGVCVMPLGLQTYKDEIQSLKDFKEGDKVAYPAPGSIQHILLSMAAEKELGSPTALDDFGVAMAHPDAAAALISKKDISAHFTSPPYNFQELSTPGIRQIVDGTQAFGSDFSFLVAVASKDLYEKNPQVYAAFVLGLSDAAAFINEQPEAAAKILAPSFKLDEATTLKYLTWPGMNYTTTPYGLMGFSDFMVNAGYIKNAPKSVSDIAWYNVVSTVGEMQGETPSALEKLQYRP